jgi:concanavalin A-like lectin/glucanase superfamily protein
MFKISARITLVIITFTFLISAAHSVPPDPTPTPTATPVVSSVSFSGTEPLCGSVTVTYTISHAHSLDCSIPSSSYVQYALAGTSTWSDATINGTLSGLSTSSGGVQHQFTWNTATDLSNLDNEYKLRIKVRDSNPADSDYQSSSDWVFDNKSPVFSGLDEASSDWSVYPDNVEGDVTLDWSSATDSSTPVKYDVYMAEGFESEIDYTSPDYSDETATEKIITDRDSRETYKFAVRSHDGTSCSNEDTNTVVRKIWGCKWVDYLQNTENTADLLFGYDFDEGSGDSCDDAGPDNNDGTRYGATWISNGIFDDALDFDGVDDRVSCSVTNASVFTIECWFKADSENSGALISSLQSYTGGYQRGYEFGVQSGKLHLFIGMLDWEYNTEITGSASVETGKWYHAVATLDGDGDIALYLDGQLDVTGTKNGIESHTGYTIGCSRSYLGSGYNNFFNGVIDSPAVYDEAMDAQWVASHYDRTPRGSVSINDGDAYTTVSTVTLHLDFDYPTDAEVYIKSGDVTGENTNDWIDFASEVEVSLADTDNPGTVTVYVKFRDSSGNETWPVTDYFYYIKPGVPCCFGYSAAAAPQLVNLNTGSTSDEVTFLNEPGGQIIIELTNLDEVDTNNIQWECDGYTISGAGSELVLPDGHGKLYLLKNYMAYFESIPCSEDNQEVLKTIKCTAYNNDLEEVAHLTATIKSKDILPPTFSKCDNLYNLEEFSEIFPSSRGDKYKPVSLIDANGVSWLFYCRYVTSQIIYQEPYLSGTYFSEDAIENSYTMILNSNHLGDYIVPLDAVAVETQSEKYILLAYIDNDSSNNCIIFDKIEHNDLTQNGTYSITHGIDYLQMINDVDIEHLSLIHYDDTFWIAYEKNDNIYYRIYDITADEWGSEQLLAVDIDDEKNPILLKNNNGDLYAFYSRIKLEGTLPHYNNVYYKKYSSGIWSADTLWQSISGSWITRGLMIDFVYCGGYLWSSYNSWFTGGNFIHTYIRYNLLSDIETFNTGFAGGNSEGNAEISIDSRNENVYCFYSTIDDPIDQGDSEYISFRSIPSAATSSEWDSTSDIDINVVPMKKRIIATDTFDSFGLIAFEKSHSDYRQLSVYKHCAELYFLDLQGITLNSSVAVEFRCASSYFDSEEIKVRFSGDIQGGTTNFESVEWDSEGYGNRLISLKYPFTTGLKTIYIEFQDSFGNTSSKYPASIYYFYEDGMVFELNGDMRINTPQTVYNQGFLFFGPENPNNDYYGPSIINSEDFTDNYFYMRYFNADAYAEWMKIKSEELIIEDGSIKGDGDALTIKKANGNIIFK